MSVSRRFGSARKAKAAIRSGGGANGVLRRLKDGDKLVVRFLQGPDDWEVARYHYIDGTFAWCMDPEKNGPRKCEHCEGGSKSSQVILSNVLDVKENKVIILQMAKTLADSMFRYYEKFDETVIDRDYEVSREGSGQTDTKYFAIPEGGRLKRELSRYSLHDISAMIYADAGEEAPEDETEPEDEEPRSSKKSNPRRPSSHVDEDDDYEDEDEEEEFEDDEEEEEEDQYADLTRPELKAEIKKYDPSFVAKKSQSDDDLREILIDLASDADEDDEEEEEEEEEVQRPRSSSLPKQKKRSQDAEDEFRPKKSTATAVKGRIRRPNSPS